MSPFSGGEFKVLHLKTNFAGKSFIHTKSKGFVRKKILRTGVCHSAILLHDYNTAAAGYKSHKVNCADKK